MSVTHNDPIAALEEIYDDSSTIGEEDKNTLRSWVRDFLSKARPGSEITNILILEQDQKWSRRFVALRRRFGVFAADCATVQEDLVVKKAVSRIGNEKRDLKSASSNERGKDKGVTHAFCDPSYSHLGIHQLDALGLQLPDPLLRITLQGQHEMHSPLPPSPLSPSELQLLRNRFPSMAILYEKTLEEKKEKTETRSKSKSKGKGQENDGDDNSKSCPHQCEHCRFGPSGCSYHIR
jgi:hypothetical protein